MDNSELDALDRRVAELRGWKWNTDSIAPSPFKSAPLAVIIGNLPTVDFQPTRDARQAMVLLGEIPNVVIRHFNNLVWEVCYSGHTPWNEGDTLPIAATRCYIAWKESQNV